METRIGLLEAFRKPLTRPTSARSVPTTALANLTLTSRIQRKMTYQDFLLPISQLEASPRARSPEMRTGILQLNELVSPISSTTSVRPTWNDNFGSLDSG